MLYDVIFGVLAIYAMLTPLMVIKSIKYGIKLAENPKEVAEAPIFNVPKPKAKPKMSPEQKKAMQILSNIEAYDGTSLGQKEI